MSDFKLWSLFTRTNSPANSFKYILQRNILAILSLLILTTAFSFTAFGQTTDFENPPFSTGSINSQNGWSSTGSFPNSPGFDHAVVQNSTLPTAPPVSFGAQSLRMSNAVTSGSFADFTFSSSTANEAGEATAENGGMSGGTRQRQFTAQWDFISADPTGEQPGLLLTANPDRGDGSRMSFVQMADTPGGININFFDYQRGLGNTCASGNNFVSTVVATGLSRTVLHTIRIEMDFLPGIANDVVRIYVDGVLSHTGTSWEDFFRDCQPPSTRTVDSILFRQSGTPSPASAGKGFLVDNLTLNTTSQTAITVTPAAVPTAADNDYTRINNAVHSIANGGTITLNGTFNWAEPFAAASWALGSDGQTGVGFDLDDYSILVPNNLNNVTFTAATLGAATIQGPGDLPALSLESVFFFFNANQGWTISNIRFLDFDLSIGMFNGSGGVTAYNNTTIQNNYFRMPQDLNATVASADDFQNIGIHYSFGSNQTISGNTFDIPGNSVSDSANSNFATNVAMQSNTSGGAVYNGLQVTNNTINVLNAQTADPEVIIGFWENAHGHTSNITVSDNQFLNAAPGNNPATNLQRGFRVTSHSSATTMVNYTNNRVEGANIGFQFLSTSANTGPVLITRNLILNNSRGVVTNTNGMANLSFNRIVGNSVAGVDNTLGLSVIAENNWWGCNYGPGVGGSGCVGTANGILGAVDANPWLTLRTSASPNSIVTGGTSTISSNLNFNFDNVNTSGFGSVPNTTPATFTGTLGTVSPTSSTTTSGVTGTTFTAGVAAGAGGAQTTIDGQTVNAPITIAFSCNNVTVPPTTNVNSNTQFLVPISVDSTNGRGILSYDFTLNYNPAVITPIAVETTGTLSDGWSITTNNSSGTLVVSGFNSNALTGSGVLLNVRFISTGGIGTTSPIAIPSFRFNEGVPCVNPVTSGLVTIISGTVGGRVTYVNAIGPPSGPPPPVPVPNTTLNAAGSIPLSTSTNSMGFYSLSGFGAGPYTVTPSKANQIDPSNGFSPLDASRVAQHVVGFITLNATQQIAADVTGNGTITSLDAAYIAQFIVGIPNPGFTGSWRFLPANRSYPNVLTSFANQDYDAILLGDVTGNWNPAVLPIPPPLAGQSEQVKSKPQQGVSVTATVPQAVASGANFTVDLMAYNRTDEDILGYQFELLYDANVMTASQVAPCDNAGTISRGLSLVCNPGTPGVLRVVIFGASSIDKSGTLLKLNFTAVGKVGARSALTFQNFKFNEDLAADVTVDREVVIADTGKTRR